MNELYLVSINQLNVGDRLVREKGPFSKHHGIYVGIHNSIPLVAENQIGMGVQYVSLSQFLLFNPNNLTRIERFAGTEYARALIISRINQLRGTNYDLINFNCEHFAEFIQTGNSESKQVKNAFAGLGVLAFIGLVAWAAND
jgi:hypothetical protein